MHNRVHSLSLIDFLKEEFQLCRQNIREFGGMFENYHPETGKGLYAVFMMSWNILADVIDKEIESGDCALQKLIDSKAQA
jgi:hypothetical protein